MSTGDIEAERTSSKMIDSRSGLTSVALQAGLSQSSMEADAEAPESAFQSAYTAPPYPRPQADRDHEQEVALDRERGDLTARNLEQIPNAEQVAPGIRLDRGGNDFDYPTQGHGQRNSHSRETKDESNAHPAMEDEDHDERLIPHSGARKTSILSVNAPSSVDATGRSSNGRAEMDMSNDRDGDNSYEEDDEMYDEKNLSVVHERVGGSGATSENASKGASVGHFGPLGEAIPGVPPHLDPRQPHFRPPSPSAASVVSVAVHPPASPKYNSISGLGSVAGGGEYGSSSSLHHDISDSGEETESFENGAMTPTLSEEIDDDEDMDKDKFSHGREYDASSPTPSPSLAAADTMNPFNFGRLNMGGPQVSFSDNVLSRDLDGFTSLSRTARAPSIAATAGSSRAPSARGLSPPASISRGGTATEGSSMEEYGSTGTGLGESGIETPSMVRSQRSSYSAPSSEVEPTNGSVGMDAAEAATRARGATLIANAERSTAGASSGHLQDETEDDLRGAPSLAPSEAGSDSTRSVTQDSSSVGHGLYPYPSSGAMAVGGHSSSDRMAYMPSSTLNTSSPGTFEAHSFSDAAVPRGGSSSLHPVLPSLLAIKRAAVLRRESGAGSTVATAGTASPGSSLSVDGDSERGGLD